MLESWLDVWVFLSGKTVGDDLKDEADIKIAITTVFCMVCAEHQCSPTCLIISQRHGTTSCECQAAACLPQSIQTVPCGFDHATCSESIKHQTMALPERLSLEVLPVISRVPRLRCLAAKLGSVLPAATQFLALTAGLRVLLEIN